MRLLRNRVLFPIFLVLAFLIFYRDHYEVPILMYHQVGGPGPAGGTNVSTETFNRQMEFLKVHRYHVISLKQLVELLRSGQKVPRKTVVITFDDGNLDNFINAFPILKKLKFPATIFMITRNIDEPGWLSEEDIRILDDSGIAIGSHTVNHAFLPKLDKEEAIFEIRQSKKRIEKILNRSVTLFSYPAGGVTTQVREWVRAEGYEGAVTTNYGTSVHDIYALHRIKISEANGNLFGFWIKTSGLYHLGKKRISMDPDKYHATVWAREY